MRASPTIARGVTRHVPSLRAHVVACAIALAGSAAWAMWASPEVHLPRAPVQQFAPADEEGGAPSRAAFDLSAFHSPIWVTPPAPPPEPRPPAAPPPTKLQLLALTRESGVAKALLYDPETDCVLSVSVGDKVSQAEVEEITSDRVVIADAAGRRHLRLDASTGGGP